MMIVKIRPKKIVWNMVIRDIRDVAVLRKLSLLQLADSNKLKMLKPQFDKDVGIEDGEGLTIVSEEQLSDNMRIMIKDGIKAPICGRENENLMSQKKLKS